MMTQSLLPGVRPLSSRIEYLPGIEGMGAIISADQLYRYALWRQWDRTRPLALICGLNPSKADAITDDHTIRREVHYAAREWSCGGLLKVNLGALRSTDSSVLMQAGDWVGRENLMRITDALTGVHGRIGKVVVAWGATPAPGRENHALSVLSLIVGHGFEPLCFGMTKDGHPKHPARLPNGVKLIPFEWNPF